MLWANLRDWLRGKTPVVVESPYAGEVEANIAYAQWALLDAIHRGETPYASHLLLTQALHDDKPDQRELGLRCSVAMPGRRAYYVNRCPIASRKRRNSDDLETRFAEQRRQVVWGVLWNATRLFCWAVLLAVAIAAAAFHARRAFVLGSDLGMTLVGAWVALWFTSNASRAITDLVSWIGLARTNRVLSPGMLRAFVRHPGELRTLGPAYCEMAERGVGPTADKMTWGEVGASGAYTLQVIEERDREARARRGQ